MKIDRRKVLQGGAAMGALALVPHAALALPDAAEPIAKTKAGRVRGRGRGRRSIVRNYESASARLDRRIEHPASTRTAAPTFKVECRLWRA